MKEHTETEGSSAAHFPSDEGEIMEQVLDFFLEVNPHVKCSMNDIGQRWGTLTKQQSARLTALLKNSGLFIVFEKKGNDLFMIKDSAREQLIEAGSYQSFLDRRKHQREMSEEELAMARLRDKEDEMRMDDENLRRTKAKENRLIMIVGILVLVVLIIIAKMLLGKIKGR
jgi:hypothetical protein